MIGIHDSPGSFSDRWIERCQEKGISFKRLNCLSTDIIQQCSGVRAVLWHWTLGNVSEQLVARQIIAALEQTGALVFPNVLTCWHYDDKIAQKFVLEAVAAPLIPTWVFTDRDEANEWVARATWPKVFKLRCGAGSSNVWLVRSRTQAQALLRRAFGRGFAARPGYLYDARTRARKVKDFRDMWRKLLRGPQSLMTLLQIRTGLPRQKRYAYFQEFMPGNAFDTRITIIGQRAFGFLRKNRPGDFRASGSGQIDYDPDQVDKRCVEIALEVAEKLGTQSLAFDFLFDASHEPRISEISYCYAASAVHACKGCWDRGMRWHEGHFWPQDAILEDVLAVLGDRDKRESLRSL
jgi:glutathione synthase/RimK-type ligase-like ATP-grasp enzyme